MVIDLHAHYPMHIVPPAEGSAHEGLLRWGDESWRAQFVNFLSRIFGYEGPRGAPGVTIELMRKGNVGALLSVLYNPLDEMDVSKQYGSPPDAAYLPRLFEQLEAVEESVAADPGPTTVAHSRSELQAALAANKCVLIHCVEGGFHLGGTDQEIHNAVSQLADRGVAYITLAHLFWRDVATNAPALPFVPDPLYRRIFRQPDLGLSELGEAAAEAMLDHQVLIDLTHMSSRAAAKTLDLMDHRDPNQQVPVLATHEACRLGRVRRREYNLSDETIRRIAKRAGLIGVIFCPHYILGGGPLHRMQTRSFKTSVDALCRHIDHIREVTGSSSHVGIGSDLDGWIKPALTGLGHLGRMAALEEELRNRYGPTDAEKICSGNALRVLTTGWR
jgi:microsomal dipeptidase-like Zn-dependent dipeptidase